MQRARTQEIDVTRSRETAASLVRRLERSGQPIKLTKRGRVVARVMPETAPADQLVAVPLAEQRAAWKRLRKIQQKTGRMMERTGKTEDELMKIILADD
jgi:antitoxin (DNA-binding transcriptional repressor) of toxin-antitoxin stability system